MSYIIKYMHKQINKYDYLSKFYYCTQWHINCTKLLLWLCVLFYSSFVYTCVCVFLHIQSPLRECRPVRSGASGLPCYCAPLVCISVVIGLLAVWQHNKPKTKKSLGLPHTPSFSVCLFTWVGVVCVCFLLCLSNKFTMKYTQIKNEIWVNIIMNSNKITFLNLIDTCVTESIDVIIPLLIS